MSAKSATEEAPAAAAASPAPSKRVLVLAVAGAILLAGAGAGAGSWMYLKKDVDEDAEEAPAKVAKPTEKKSGKKGDKAEKDARKDAKKVAKSQKPPVFVPLDPFTVNLQGTGRENFLQVGLVLEAVDGPAADAVKQSMPVIRSAVLLLLAGKTAEELAKPEGKDRLAAEVLARVKNPSEGIGPFEGIERIHYAAFIIQ